MKRIAILGSTGSIGRSALAVVEQQAGRLEVVGLAAGDSAAMFLDQVRRFRPAAVALRSGSTLAAVVAAARDEGLAFRIAVPGHDGLRAVATMEEADLVLCASSGTAALEAVLAAIEAGKTIALANKEVLVMAGALVMEAARRHGVEILPVDSEHNAVHQCVHGRAPTEIRRIILTASGGPFLGAPSELLQRVSAEDALRHPTWRMGPKITIDSATLMNKGLEVIEARWLFDVPAASIDVLVHPQSIVHSLVELRDGSVLAQLGVTDMRLPIQYAFSWPDRWESALPALDLAHLGRLEFAHPDHDRFPCLRLAYRALASERTLPAVLNAANEIAVDAFLDGRVGFTRIPAIIEQTLEAADVRAGGEIRDLADVRALDRWARDYSLELARALQST